MILNLIKASIAVAVAPIALLVDIATLPASAEDCRRGPFDRTGKTLSVAGECIKQAITPEKP